MYRQCQLWKTWVQETLWRCRWMQTFVTFIISQLLRTSSVTEKTKVVTNCPQRYNLYLYQSDRWSNIYTCMRTWRFLNTTRDFMVSLWEERITLKPHLSLPTMLECCAVTFVSVTSMLVIQPSLPAVSLRTLIILKSSGRQSVKGSGHECENEF